MAEIDSDVYDVFHPTPVSLKQLSAMAVSLEVWRCEANEYRDNCKLEDFNPSDDCILLRTVLPDLPSEIYDVIDENVIKFCFSMDRWLRSHLERVFYSHYSHRNNVLEHFEDFVCDYNGAIHYVRTAERMMLCNRFDASQKFTIACTYFFEDDIRRLWPLVSVNMNLNGIDFSKSPQLYYWICCLTNKLDTIPTDQINHNVEEVMLNSFMPYNRPSLEYFWNRVPSENRMRKADDIYKRSVLSFARFILPKLNDQELGEFLNEKCYHLMDTLFRCVWYDKEFILSTWMQIQNSLNEYAVANQFLETLKYENNPTGGILCFPQECVAEEKRFLSRNWNRFCCELWNSAAEKLKQAAVKVITSKINLFEDFFFARGLEIPTKKYEFLSTVLSYATYDEKKTFWNYHWRVLVDETRCQDFEKIMNLCFEKEDDLTHFKQNVMSRDVTFLKLCNIHLEATRFNELNDFANLLWPEIPTSRNNFKQQVLQSVLFGNLGQIDVRLLNKAKEFDEFINDAYGDADLSKNFKDQLMSSPQIQNRLPSCALRAPIENFVEFIDTFVSNEEILLQIKTGINEFLKDERAAHWIGVVPESSFMSLLSWCLGSDEEAEKCKPSYL